MFLKPDKCVSYMGHATELGRRVTNGPVFQLQQMGQFGLIQLADAFFDILEEDKIQERLEPLVVVGKYLRRRVATRSSRVIGARAKAM
jgi:hypothetical protein